jgi:hypothetical protein
MEQVRTAERILDFNVRFIGNPPLLLLSLFYHIENAKSIARSAIEICLILVYNKYRAAEIDGPLSQSRMTALDPGGYQCSITRPK